MNILHTIIEQKKKEVERHKAAFGLDHLLRTQLLDREPVSFKESILMSSHGIIAEFKRKSPSKGWIHPDACVEQTILAYSDAGAAAISVLTDEHFFGGSLNDLRRARQLTSTPLLRKDFIVDDYQIYQAKAVGADCILLIAAALSVQEVTHFTQLAHSLGLEVLLEVHNEQELETIVAGPDMVGVNNRNLKTFVTSLENSLRLAELIPDEFVKISESGISSTDSLDTLRKAGYEGFLMGENFMKHHRPGEALVSFAGALQSMPA